MREAADDLVDRLIHQYNLTKNQAFLVAARIDDLHEADAFLSPRLSQLPSPFLMKDMYQAVKILRNAISNHILVGLFSDSDLDGLTSLTIMHVLFKRFNHPVVSRYLVQKEQYGLTRCIIDEFHHQGVRLIITLDSGIRDIEEIAYARSLGMDVIVCDHHEPANQLPDACIINPKQTQCRYPYKEIAGVGVAFKLCHGLLMSYLPAFKQNHLVLLGCEQGISCWNVRDGVIGEVSRCNDTKNLLDLLKKSVEVFLWEERGDSISELLKSHSRKFHDLRTLKNLLTEENDNYLNRNGSNLCAGTEKSNSEHFNEPGVLKIYREIQFHNSPKIREFLYDIVGYVALGTIADIVPLIGESRTIVFCALQIMNQRKDGLFAEIVGKRVIDSKVLGWDVAPLLNTPGRFGKTELTASYLINDDIVERRRIIDEIKIINEERKGLIARLYKKIITDLHSERSGDVMDVHIIIRDDVPEGIAGLLANRISEYARRPIILITGMDNADMVKGSGRCAGNFNFFSYVEPYAEMFDKIGGHPQAFGFTIHRNRLEEMSSHLYSALKNQYVDEAIAIDKEICVDDVDISFIEELKLLEPFGHKNEEPVFLSRRVPVRGSQAFGAQSNHLKLLLGMGNGIEAIGWNMADMIPHFLERETLDIVFKAEVNDFNGYRSPRLVVIDWN